MFDWLTAAVVAYPFSLAVAGLLMKEVPRFGGAYWAWTYVVVLPVVTVLFSVALEWPWWATLLYFALIFALTFFGKLLQKVKEGF